MHCILPRCSALLLLLLCTQAVGEDAEIGDAAIKAFIKDQFDAVAAAAARDDEDSEQEDDGD